MKKRIFAEQAKILEKVDDKVLNAKVFEKISQENFDRLHAAARQANNGKELDLLTDAKRSLIKSSNLESLTESFNVKDANVSIEFLEPLEYVVEQEEEQIEQEIEQINSELNDKDTMQGSLF